MKSNKKISGGILIMIGILFTGCATNKWQNFVYDGSLPIEQTAKLKLPLPVKGVQFDGKNVSWGGWSDMAFHQGTIVTVPSGQHSFVFDYYKKEVIGTYTGWQEAKGLSVSRDLKPGLTYAVDVVVAGKQANISITLTMEGLEFKDGVPKELVGQWSLEIDGQTTPVLEFTDSQLRLLRNKDAQPIAVRTCETKTILVTERVPGKKNWGYSIFCEEYRLDDADTLVLIGVGGGAGGVVREPVVYKRIK